MPPVVLPLHDPAGLAAALADGLGGRIGEVEMRRFPDGETYLRLGGDLNGADVVIACGLDAPDAKIVPLYLAATTARDLGARRVLLAAPYLPYLRQDCRFHDGESVSAPAMARLLSSFLDGLATVDPHLHRISALGDVFAVPAAAASAAGAIADWIGRNVPDAFLIGPDGESAQWVSRIAALAGRPFAVLDKTRRGDRDVEIRLPVGGDAPSGTPVFVDDIVSTGRTLIAAAAAVAPAFGTPPVFAGVHALFADDAYDALKRAGAAAIVTCNTVAHPSNAIDIHPALTKAVARLLAGEVSG